MMAAASSCRSDVLGTAVASLFLVIMVVNFVITDVGAPTEKYNGGVRVLVRDRPPKSTASNAISAHDSAGARRSTSVTTATAASDASVILATHSPAVNLATPATYNLMMAAFQRPSFDVEPLVPLTKLSANESAIFLACQRSSFARHQRPPPVGGPRFIIVQTVEFGKKSKPMFVPYMFNRAAWAEAFGYEFVRKAPPEGTHGYAQVASAKPRVLLEVLQEHLGPLQAPRTRRAEWIILMDADTFVNPDDPPDFDALLSTVSDEKVLLVAQAEYLNTGVVFVRVRRDAVSQLEKWVAIMDSGVIKCHPWDQAGLQWMFANAIDPTFPITTVCAPPQCGAAPGGKFYSCTPIFEQVVERRYGCNRAVNMGISNNDTGPLGVVLNRDKNTVLHCWGCFGSGVCEAPETQANKNLSKARCEMKARQSMMWQSADCLKARSPGGRLYGMQVVSLQAPNWQINHGGDSTREFKLRYSRCLGSTFQY